MSHPAPTDLLLPRIGARKAAIVSLVPPCALGAEIGADHGLISAHLLREGRCERMVVSDVSAASLDKARRLFLLHGLSERAVLRVADGLAALDGLDAPQAVVIAGMGAQSIAGILSRAGDALARTDFILQPNPDPPFLRRWLAAHGFCVQAERLCYEGGRYYVAMRARRGASADSDRALWLGPCLMQEKPPLWLPYLAWRRDCLLAARAGGAQIQQQLQWLEEEIAHGNRDGADSL